MDRRTLLRHLLLGLPVGMALPTLLSSCKDDDFIDGAQFQGKVIIIGAGASGIYAAHLLLKYGIDVTVLEASNKTGGRIQSNNSFVDITLEMGAEEIHGRKSVLYDLAQYFAPSRLNEVTGDDYYWISNQLRTEKFIIEAEELNGGGATLFNILESYGSYPGSDMLLSEYLTAFPLDPRLELIANALTGNEYGSSNDRVGMLALKEAEAAYSSGLENFNFKTGSYWNLFETAFADAINKVTLNAPVTSIDYSGNQVLVKTNNGTEYQADRVLVTVPLTMLKNNSIGFVPALPSNKLQAISKIDMGIGIKVTLQFSAAFWLDGTSSIVGGLKVPEYWVTSNGKDTGFSYLTAFLMGPSAEELALLSHQQAVQDIIAELVTMFPSGAVASKFTGAFVYKNWADEPFIGGAYSFPSITSTGQREILASPVNSKVYFAGEATNYNGHLATVHGAMESGFRAVKEIIQA